MELSLGRAGTKVRLGQELGRGGEGRVVADLDDSGRVAKLYREPAGPRQVGKLLAMTRAAKPAVLQIAAWPSDLIVDGEGAVWGFVMPRVGAKQDIHELYSPKSRSELFPQADFRFVVHVAANVAKAFATLHAERHVIGDVNHGNLLVGSDGTVTLIDCDSIQVTDGNEVYPCDVGVPLFTPPELQGLPLRGMRRSESHDRFGLAVLVFHLLYMGRHPYAGRFLDPGEMPIERAIAECRFAYGPDRVANRMERPPGSVPLEAMGAEIPEAFQRAFGQPGAARTRPSAEEWVALLGALASRLRVCVAANWHHYPADLRSCPWCEVEDETGARLFGPKMSGWSVTGPVDLEELVRAIAGIAGPRPDPVLPSQRGGAPPDRLIRRARRRRPQARMGRHSFAPAVADEAAAAWERAQSFWLRQATRALFDARRRQFEAACDELEALPQERTRRLQILEREREVRQFQRFLDRFLIGQAHIDGIGPSRTAMLASYGIETAADVDRRSIAQIPGFSRSLANQLGRWAERMAATFVFNPNEPVDRRDIAVVDRELHRRRQALLEFVAQGPDALRALTVEIDQARERLLPVLEEAWAELTSERPVRPRGLSGVRGSPSRSARRGSP